MCQVCFSEPGWLSKVRDTTSPDRIVARAAGLTERNVIRPLPVRSPASRRSRSDFRVRAFSMRAVPCPPGTHRSTALLLVEQRIRRIARSCSRTARDPAGRSPPSSCGANGFRLPASCGRLAEAFRHATRAIVGRAADVNARHQGRRFLRRQRRHVAINSPAKNPFSQTRCSALNGALLRDDRGKRCAQRRIHDRHSANKVLSATSSWRWVKTWNVFLRRRAPREICLSMPSIMCGASSALTSRNSSRASVTCRT